MVDLDTIDVQSLSDEDLATALQTARRLECSVLEHSYYDFLKAAWHVLEPTTVFLDNWHIRFLCSIVEREIVRVGEGRPKDKDHIVNIRPRSAKSHIFNRGINAWAWIRWPGMKFIVSSYSGQLSLAMNLDSRRLIESDWYQERWGDKFQITSDQNQKAWYDNDRGGKRIATSTGASIIGKGYDVLVVDDPQDPQSAASDVERKNAKDHWGHTLYSRMDNQRVGWRLLVMQRLHEDDLTGHLLANEADSYEHICIPTVLSDDLRPERLRVMYRDGLFWPERFGADVVARDKLPTNLGLQQFAAQCQQRPTPAEGGTFKRHWWRFWKRYGEVLPPVEFKGADGSTQQARVVDLPAKLDRVIDSWDTALEGKSSSDDVAGHKIAVRGAQKFVLQGVCGKLDYPTTRKAVLEMYQSDGITSAVLIERTANGPAVKADLESVIPCIIDKPVGRLSKEDRVKLSDTVPYAAQVEAGNVYLPHPSRPGCKWVLEFIEEHAKFPKSAQDGRVDSMSQGVNYLTTARHVWPYFHVFDPMHRRSFVPDWREDHWHACAVVLNKDLSVSVLAAFWLRRERKMYVYGSMDAKRLSPLDLARQMFKGLQLDQRILHRIIGSELWFEDFGKSAAVIFNQELNIVFRQNDTKTGPSLAPVAYYDRMGSIDEVNVMFQRNQIIVHPECEEPCRQWSGWVIEGNKPMEGQGHCEALTMLVSEVNRMERHKVVPPPPDTYKPLERNVVDDPQKKENKSWQIA